MSMNANTPQLLIPSIESVGSQAIINSRPQLPICDHQFEHRSLKRPRDSQTTLNLRRTALIKRQPQCLKFKRGYCNFGDNCHFSHGQELLAKHGEDNHTIISRMRLCWRFCNGEECLYGDRCHFLHEIPEKFRGDSGISTKNCRINVLGSETCDEPERFVKRNGLNPNQVHQRSGGWKTRLCNKWETTGQCSYGLRCYFAHGSGELRRLATHDALESRNISISKTLATTARDESSSKTGSGTKRQLVLGERCLFKWKEVERISGIYADWVDDMPLENGSPGKVDH